MPSPSRMWPRVALSIINGVVIAWIASVGAVLAWGRRDNAQQADAIVVLGAAQYAGHPSPVLKARLDHALELWQRGFAQRLILTGGMGRGDTTSEAAVGRRYVVRRGVPDSAILLERDGRTTKQSLAAVAAVMHERGMTRAIFVSDPFHMLRLSILSRSFDLTCYTSPTKTSPISANKAESLEYVVSESFKVPLTILV